MKTKKVYYDDVNLRESTAKVLEILSCKDNPSDVLIVLDETIFFPTGGGQSCDLGTINNLPVTDVSAHVKSSEWKRFAVRSWI